MLGGAVHLLELVLGEPQVEKPLRRELALLELPLLPQMVEELLPQELLPLELQPRELLWELVPRELEVKLPQLVEEPRTNQFEKKHLSICKDMPDLHRGQIIIFVVSIFKWQLSTPFKENQQIINVLTYLGFLISHSTGLGIA